MVMPSATEFAQKILSGERSWVGRGITLVESTRPQDQELASQLLEELLEHTGGAWRVGITGVPGAGKSTLVDSLGAMLVEQGHKVGVLAVDPSSAISGGSILGDKTRMNQLASNPNAFIRPSAAMGKLGGTTRAAREALLILEAAGYDIVFVETVGVGQSESQVADMVDFFLLVLIPGAGDELQGIKRGVVELADHIVVNKADSQLDGQLDGQPGGRGVKLATQAAAQYRSALQLLTPKSGDWRPSVGICSALEQTGIQELWDVVSQHRQKMTETGALAELRCDQQVRWMWSLLEDKLISALRGNETVKQMLEGTIAEVSSGSLSPPKAADKLLEAFKQESH